MNALSRRTVVALVLGSLTWHALSQPPTVEQAQDKVVVTNAFYRATLLGARGGTLSEVAFPDGKPVLNGDLLYTDHGLYPEGNTVGSDKETNATMELRQEGERVVVESRGTLRGEGALREPERRVDYAFTYTFDPSSTIHVHCSATPGFALKDPSGFFSYLVSVPHYSEWFAKTADGVIFQPAGPVSTRTFQSANEPLDFEDPWVGLLLPDGGLVAWSNLRGSPALTNVFMHESGQGSTGFFCAWLCGPGVADLVPGQPWIAEFDLHLWPQSAQSTLAIPDFLG